jgi:hypothetical protein
MRKSLSLSAIVSGLMATPLFAAVPPPPRPNQSADVSVVEKAPDVLAQLHQQLQAVDAGQPLDAHGMQQLQQRINSDMQGRLDRALAHYRDLAGAARFYQVEDLSTRNVRLEKSAFLGVSTSPVSATLREQLQLPRGMGLVVDYIEKDSPAAEAGFHVHDVLHKLEDQLLINPQQLMVLVRARKPGDIVNFSIIRGGKSMTLSAKLSEKELPPLESFQEPGFWNGQGWGGGMGGGLQPMPRQDLFIRPHQMGSSVKMGSDGSETRTLSDDQNTITLHREKDKNGDETPMHLLVKDRDGTTIYDGLLDQASLAPEIQKKVDDLRKQDRRVMIRADGPAGPGRIQAGGIIFNGAPEGASSSSVKVTRADGQDIISMRFESRPGEKIRTLRVQDAQTGKVLFDGPIQSDEDLKSLPPAILEKVNKLRARLDAP